MLTSLRSRLYLAGFPAINFMIVSSMLVNDEGSTKLLHYEAENETRYQENQGESAQDTSREGNDQVLVLDRCGRMAYQVITPFSKLIYPYVKAAILSTYQDNPCGFCNLSVHTRPNHPKTTEPKEFFSQTENQPLMFPGPSKKESTDGTQASNKSHLQRTVVSNANQLMQLFDQKTDSSESAHQNIQDGSQKFEYDTERGKQQDQQETDSVNQSDLKNWDWSTHKSYRSANDSDELPVENSEQSVEVLQPLNIRSSKWGQKYVKARLTGKKSNWMMTHIHETAQHISTQSNNMQRKKGLEINENLRTPLIETNCERSPDCESAITDASDQNSFQSGGESTQSVGSNTMEELFNQTQKLFDWHQRQIENRNTTEDSYDMPNQLRDRIIEHYRKLLPWLHFKLTPKHNQSI